MRTRQRNRTTADPNAAKAAPLPIVPDRRCQPATRIDRSTTGSKGAREGGERPPVGKPQDGGGRREGQHERGEEAEATAPDEREGSDDPEPLDRKPKVADRPRSRWESEDDEEKHETDTDAQCHAQARHPSLEPGLACGSSVVPAQAALSARRAVDVARAAVAGSLLRETRAERFRRHPCGQAETRFLADHEIELVAAERGQPVDAVGGKVQRRGRVFEGDASQRSRQAGEHLGLVALDVDLAEGGLAVFLDQEIEGRHLDRHAAVPLDVPEAVVRRDPVAPVAGKRRDRGVIGRDRERRAARLAADRAPVEPNPRGIEAAGEIVAEQGLRFEGDDLRPGPRQRAGAAADMGADVEGEVARSHQRGQEPVDPAPTPRLAVVDDDRTPEAERGRVDAHL